MIRTAVAIGLLTLVACGQVEPDTPEVSASAPARPIPLRPTATRDLARDFTALAVAPDADPAAMETLAKDTCGSRDFCKVSIWTDESTMPRGFPMTDREVAATAFAYSLNRTNGFEQAMWDCARFPQGDSGACL